MPLMIMLIGFAFLLGELGMVSMHTVGIIWPILVIIAAGTKMNEDKCTCCMKPM